MPCLTYKRGSNNVEHFENTLCGNCHECSEYSHSSGPFQAVSHLNGNGLLSIVLKLSCMNICIEQLIILQMAAIQEIQQKHLPILIFIWSPNSTFLAMSSAVESFESERRQK